MVKFLMGGSIDGFNAKLTMRQKIPLWFPVVQLTQVA